MQHRSDSISRARLSSLVLAIGLAGVGTFTFCAIASGDAVAQDKGAQPKPPGEEQDSSLKRTTAASFKIETSFDRKTVERTKQADLKRDEEIELLKKLVPKAPESRKAEMIFRLAELYWEKSKYKYTLEFEQFEAAYEEWSKAGSQGTPPKTKDFIRESELIKKNALKLYEKVLTEYPTYRRNDEVLFYLGYNEYEDGKTKVAVNHYWTLIKQFPKSRLVADAYLQLGEHFFNNNQVIKARKSYERATASDEARIKYYAIYKLAWCDYNIQEYASGIKKLKTVIDHSDTATDKKSLQLGSEALGDLARFFSYVDEVDSAFAYFRKKGGEGKALQYTSRLGALYHEQGKWNLEIATYRLLVEKFPMNDKAPYLQANIVEAFSKMGKKDKVRKEVERLVDLYRPGTPWYRHQKDRGEQGVAALEYAYDLTETKLRDLVTEYHRDAQKRKDVQTYFLARDIYAKYLDAFPETSAAYQMRYFYAEVLWALLEWRNAAQQYKVVATTKTEGGKARGKYARDAAYNQILAYELILKNGKDKGSLKGVKKIREKKKKGRTEARTQTRIKLAGLDKNKSYELKKIPDVERSLSEACDLYFGIADPSDKDLPAIKFKAAYIFYKYNHFVEAAKRYFEIIDRWPGDRLSKKSANLILDSLNVQKKWDELAFYAGKFRDNRRLIRKDKKFQAEVQVILEGATYLSIQTAEKKAREVEDKEGKETQLASVASRFRKFQGDFPKSKYADKATYSAVLIYNQADELDHAIAMAEIMKKTYPKSDLTQKNDWLLAQFYERIADFKTSAKLYDHYFEEYPKDKLAVDALYNAGIYYQGLGDTDAAIKRYEDYLKKYKKRDDVAQIYWRICELHEGTKKLKKAAECFDQFRRKHKAAPKAKLYESRYRYALLLEKMKKRSQAVKEYQYLVREFPKLKKEDQKVEGSMLAAAHAGFELLEPEFSKYKKMRVTLRKSTLIGKLKKAEDLACVTSGDKKCPKEGKYVGIITYGNGDYGICALTRIGQIYRAVANSIREAPVPRRLTIDQQEIYKAELDNLALGPEEKGLQAFESALEKAYELNIYNDCTLTAQENLKELNPNKFPDLQKREYLGAEGFITAGVKTELAQSAPAPAVEEAPATEEPAKQEKTDETAAAATSAAGAP